MNVTDTIMTATHCALSVLGDYQAAAAVARARIVEEVAVVMAVVMVIHHVADSQGQVPPLADLTTEFMCRVCW